MLPADSTPKHHDHSSPDFPADPAASVSRLSRASHRLAAFGTAGLVGGLIVFLLEAIDRIVTLWPSFNSASEVPLFALYLAPSVLLGLVAGLLAGPLLALPGLAINTVARLFSRFLGKRSEAAAFLTIAAAITLVAGLTIGLTLRALGVRSLRRLGNTLSLYFMDANAPVLSQLMHTAANWMTPLLLTAIFIVTIGVLFASRMVSTGTPRTGSTVRWVAATAVALGLVALYAFDSRFEFARYDTIVHVPSAALQFVLAYFLSALFLFGIRKPEKRKAAGQVSLAILAFALLSSTFVVIHFGSNENLKALLWRRSVVARRAYQATTFLIDRDRDGFASVLAGGDTDDTDPGINPLASEVPGNGIDDNCIGGDAVAQSIESSPAAIAPAARGKRFVLIAIDTLRADRMSLYGYGRQTTPRIDEHAQSGLVFEKSSSSGTNTAVAFSAMQTSAFRAAVFEPNRARLFPMLEKAGYRTGQVNAVVEDMWLRAKQSSVPYRRVILDGIRDFPHDTGEAFWDADKVTDTAIAYLSALSATTPSATWVHYFDPHTPRQKMAPFDFGNSASDMYDSEVAFADREVGRLLDWMFASGFMDDAIVVLVSDHGEAFLEHGMDFHGNRPYAEQIDVPLVIWAPGLAPGRSTAPSSIVDIAPTVLEFLGLEPMPNVAGQSLLHAVNADRPIFSETPLNIVDGPFHAFAVTQNGWKLIYDTVGNTTELYDLARDPYELHNRADLYPERAAALRATLAHWLDTTRSVATASEARRILENE